MGSFHLGTRKLSEQQRWKPRLGWVHSLEFVYFFSPTGEERQKACSLKSWGQKTMGWLTGTLVYGPGLEADLMCDLE